MKIYWINIEKYLEGLKMSKSKKDFEENKYIVTLVILTILVIGVFSFIVLTELEDEVCNKTDEESNEIGEIENIKSIGENGCVVEISEKDYFTSNCRGVKSGDTLYKSEKDDCYYVN